MPAAALKQSTADATATNQDSAATTANAETLPPGEATTKDNDP